MLQLRGTAQPKRDAERRKAGTMRSAACLVAALLVGACGSQSQAATVTVTATVTAGQPSATATATTPTATIKPTPEPPESVTFSAQGQQTSAPQNLRGGNYKVHYVFGGDCAYYASLKGVSNGVDKLDLATGSSKTAGDTYAYGLPSGAVYIDMNTGPSPSCPWTITLTKQ
jgi:hypothetical protein